MTQPSTPDAVRAAIAEHLQGKHPDMHFDYESGEQWSVRVFHPDSWNHITFTIYGTYFDIGYLRSLGEAIVSATNAQIGALRPVRDDDLASAFALGCSVGSSGEMTDEQEQKYARLFPESATAQLVRLKQDAPARSGDGATAPSKQDVLGAAVLFANAAHRCHLQGDYHDDDGECEHALQHLYSLIGRLPIPDAAARAGDGATVADMSGAPIAVPRHNPTE